MRELIERGDKAVTELIERENKGFRKRSSTTTFMLIK